MFKVVPTGGLNMNTGIERRPFKLLRPEKHSTAMVIARYTNREPAVIPQAPPHPHDLLWKALRVGSVCAACAFTFFVLSERNLFERASQIAGPAPKSIQRIHVENKLPATTQAADAKTLSTREPRSFVLPTDKDLRVTEFALPVTPEFQDLGGVQLKLAGVNTTTNTYDIAVRTRRREFYRQDVKLDEHVPLSRNAEPGPEIVVGEITPSGVSGYLSEPQQDAGRLAHGRRRHHRRK
jgi:hypothetical protein